MWAGIELKEEGIHWRGKGAFENSGGACRRIFDISPKAINQSEKRDMISFSLLIIRKLVGKWRSKLWVETELKIVRHLEANPKVG